MLNSDASMLSRRVAEEIALGMAKFALTGFVSSCFRIVAEGR